MSIRFGIVGTGAIAEFHARAISAIEGAEVAAACDLSPGRAEAFCSRWGGVAYTSVEEFLADPRIDVVNICTPSGAHLDPGLAAIASGRPVVVEKPLEVTTERCDRIIEAAEKKRVLLAGIFPARFSEGARAIRDAVLEGAFGRITIAHASVKWFRAQAYYDQAKWRGTWALDGGGALMNQSIHAIDLLQWFAGDVVEVSAYSGTLAHTGIEVEDTASATLRFANGALGAVLGTTAAWPGWAKRVEICGTTGSVALDDEHIDAWDFADERPMPAEAGQAAGRAAGGASDPNAIDFEGHRRELEDVIHALETGGRPLVDGREARKAVAIITSIYESARTHAPVALR